MTASMPALTLILPELILATGALMLILIGAVQGERSAPGINILSFVLIVLAAVAVAIQPSETALAFGNAFVVDGFSRFMKVLSLIGSGAALVLACSPNRSRSGPGWTSAAGT